MGLPEIHLFATLINVECPLYYSRVWDHATSLGAAFPPAIDTAGFDQIGSQQDSVYPHCPTLAKETLVSCKLGLIKRETVPSVNKVQSLVCRGPPQP